MSTALVKHTPAMGSALFRLRGLLADLQSQVRGLERDYARDIERIREFERRFRPAVGKRFDELEQLRETISRAWEALASVAAGEQPGTPGGPHQPSGRSGQAQRAGTRARALFLRLARRIHPDLVEDRDERRRRHELMAEATLAYRDGDERRLQWLLEHWEAEDGSTAGIGLDAAWARTKRQLAWARYRVRELQHATGQLHSSPTARLMHEHQRAQLAGRNLIIEMRRQVQADIRDAFREMDRARSAIAELEPSQRKAVRAACGL